jgi:outer membrane biosynthesis protein TonB
MKYYVTDRNDEVLGPYSLEEIRNLMASGSVEPSALLCEEGAETWQPLDSILTPAPAPDPVAEAKAEPVPELKPEPEPEPAPKPEPEHKPEPTRVPEPKRESEPKSKTDPKPATVTPPRKPDAPVAERGVNPVVVIGILVAFALLIYAAYVFGKRI